MSGELRERALEFFNKALDKQKHGLYQDSLKNYLISLDIQEKLAATDSLINTWVAMTLNNLGNLLSNMGKPEDAKNRYERALKMYEALLDGEPGNVVYQSQVAMTLNNLGNLLSDMGKPEDAKNRYERALKMREALLDGEPGNVVYQSQVAMTLNNLGLFMEHLGNFPDAKKYYEKTLRILKEPNYYMTIKAKSKAIIYLIQLISKEADRETNILKKSGHFKEIYDLHLNHESFFGKFNLEHEKRLAKEAGLTANIHYLMLSARNEDDPDKRIKEYEKCIQEVRKIYQGEGDEKLKELWSSIADYLVGRVLINKAIISYKPDEELIRMAVEKFERARKKYENANICYYIYSIILDIVSAKALDENIVKKLKEKLKTAIKSLPVKMNPSVIAAFNEIDSILDSKKPKYDPEIFRKINRCITKIDYSALGDILIHISEKLESYLKEPFNPNVFYDNGKITFKFDEPEKIKDRLTIRAGDRILFDEPLGKRNEIYSMEFRINPPEKREEIIIFETGDGKSVQRPINFCDKVISGGEFHEFHTIIHDCKRGIRGHNFNVAIVQLKYDMYQKDRALKIKDDKTYLEKVKMIMDEVKNQAHLVVFPEFSIPFEYLPALQEYSNINRIFIIAGTHYITDENLAAHNGLFADNFDEKDLLKNISPVIIPDSKIMHAEKIEGAKIERGYGSNIGMRHGTLNRIFKFRDDVRCGIMICYDFIDDTLRSRIIDACNLIIVPQTNDVTERFLDIARGGVGNPSFSGTRAFIMASGIFTFPKIKGVQGGDSGVILTLDKDIYKNLPDTIIKPEEIKGKPFMEQFIQLACLNMNFNPARDTQGAPVPIKYKLIHIFEKNEMSGSKKEYPQVFLDIIGKIRSCGDKDILKEILENNKALIRRFSPIWHREIWGTIKDKKSMNNFDLDQIKDKCRCIIIK
ncbi:MAG: tetratricopeptide repeat protein [Candidatus Methanoperedens sp.]|nr:tetratricopeptide repeat protein [Candidatus Methanoperedens sp.]